MKQCRRCGVVKEIGDFHRETKAVDGRCRWCKECQASASRARKATPEYRFSYYRANARSRGLTFELTLDDFRHMWAQPCCYCGERVEGIGLDRVDNEVGYVVDNVLPCCTPCNRMKSDLGLIEFIERCHRIADRLYLGWANAAIARAPENVG